MHTSVLVSFLALTLAQSPNTHCWNQDEISASRLLRFQFQLESAAERCIDINESIREDYVNFFNTNEQRISDAVTVLQQGFLARNESAGEREFDRYIISMFNLAGGEGRKSTSYCTQYRRYLVRLAKPDLTDADFNKEHSKVPTNLGPACAQAMSLPNQSSSTIKLK